MVSQSKRGPLIVEPSSLVRFPGPPLRATRARVKLINNTTSRIAFKIKTTAPSFYGVRPNAGVVFPRNSVDIEIARQPFSSDQSTKVNHKFMVQSIVVPEDVEDVSKLWQTVEPADLGIVKLRCVFEDRASTSSNPTETELQPPTSLYEPPSPERQQSPHKMATKKGDAKKPQVPATSSRRPSEVSETKKGGSRRPSDAKESADQSSAAAFSVETSANALVGAAAKSNATKQEPNVERSRAQNSTPSMESLRRVLQGGNKAAADAAPKPLIDHSDAERKNLIAQPPADKSGNKVSGKPSPPATVAKSAEPSDLGQSAPPSTYKYEMSYHSNDSTSVASKNPFSSKLSPVRLPSPEVSLNKMPERGAQPSKREPRKQRSQRSEDIFTQLQLATMNTEIHQLRTENKYLFNENSVLKDEIKHRQHPQHAIRGEYVIAHSDLPHSQREMPLCYIIASMTFAILCLVIGKFVL